MCEYKIQNDYTEFDGWTSDIASELDGYDMENIMQDLEDNLHKINRKHGIESDAVNTKFHEFLNSYKELVNSMDSQFEKIADDEDFPSDYTQHSILNHTQLGL